MTRPAPSDDLRRVRFSAYVSRLLDRARAAGMTVNEIEKATDVGNSTFYRWRDGKWTENPKATQVQKFALGLGSTVAEAYEALGWSEEPQKARQPEPTISDPEARKLMRYLNDPNISVAEKLRIRRLVAAILADYQEHHPS